MTRNSRLILHDLEISVERKRIKNINLAVCPPEGRIRVSAPLHCSEELIRSVIIARLDWIRRKRAELQARVVPPALQLRSGELVCFGGREFLLEVAERPGRCRVMLDGACMKMEVPPGISAEKRLALLHGWYRQQLHLAVPDLLARWQPVIGVEAREWRIRRMKTRWGSCNIRERRIWLNLELARMAPACLEYVLVHELVHLLERYHNARFWGLMDRFLPDWRMIRRQLKEVVLGA